MKICSKCGETKPAAAFSPERNQCRDCRNRRRRERWLAIGDEANLRRREQAAGDEALRVNRARRSAEWYKANPEHVRAYRAEYREANRDHLAKQFRAYYEVNREVYRARAQEWVKRNPDRAREHFRKGSQKRRALLRDAFVEDVDAMACYAIHGGCCGICGGFIDVATERFHIDHVIPLSRGGEHSYANTQPAHASCNLRKNNTMPDQQEAA